jgi:UDP-glucose 4-epimerase
LVTGGAGFIGSNICRQLLEEGWAVTVLDNLSSGYRHNLEGMAGLRLVEGDIRDPAAVAEASEGCGTVFHLAASVGNKRSVDDPISDAEINVLGTIRVLEAARRAGISKVVMSSSAAIFGELKTLPIAEDHPIDPDSPYGASKLGGEKEGIAYAKLYGMDVVCLRYFNVYGPNQRFDAYGNVIPIFVFSILRGEPITIFGDGDQTRDFVNVRDVVQANLKAAAAPGVSGAFNTGSGTRISINDLVKTLRAVMTEKIEVIYTDPRPFDVRDSLADIGEASRAFGFRPSVTMAEGLRAYVAWARTEHARSAGEPASS